MKKRPLIPALLFVSMLSSSFVRISAQTASTDQEQETPIGPRWWPSEWGPNDQKGAANRLTPEKVQEAARLIKSGKVYQLGRVYERGMPAPAHRTFSLIIPGSPTSRPDGENKLIVNEDMFTGEIGQMGTQFDGFGHIGVQLKDDHYFYNGFKGSQVQGTYGLRELGVEHAGAFFTRGVLIDVAAHRGVTRMNAGDVITAADLQGALKQESLALQPGDVVLIHTGHGQLWMKDNEAYGTAEPGIGMDAARWLTNQKVVLIGVDNWAIEVVPHQNPKRPFEVHQHTVLRNGVYHLENLDLSELARDKAYEFAFCFSPLRLKGATGSPGNPIAIR